MTTLQGLPHSIRFIIAIVWDLLDFTIGRIPGFGTFFDLAGGLLAVLLWGSLGVFAFWEIFEPTELADSNIPTLTLIGVVCVLGGKT